MPVLRQAGVLGFLGILLFLIVRTHVRADDRWGFSMFRDVQMVNVRYRWVDAEGGTWPADASPYIRGDGRVMLPRRDPVDWIVGLGAYTDQAHEICRFLITVRPAEGAVACEAEVRHQRFAEGPWETIVLRWPPP